MKILVVFHSITGNTAELAKAVTAGAQTVAGSEVLIKKVHEFLPQDILRQIRGYEEGCAICGPIEEVTLADLEWADAIIFGSPTHYGNMSAQMKEFIDSTGPLWLKGRLVGKAAALFTSSEAPFGGKEAALISMFFPLISHGMIVVGLPKTVSGVGTHGTYYGATSTGPPSKEDLEIAKALGQRVAQVSQKLAA